jgi:hypothetical protein
VSVSAAIAVRIDRRKTFFTTMPCSLRGLVMDCGGESNRRGAAKG